jgi:hypothetical protein
VRTGYQAARKTQKQSQTSYQRMFTLGCPNDPDRCAVIFEQANAVEGIREQDLWADCIEYRHRLSVGSWFLIIEPSIAQKTNIGSLLKLETDWPWYPLERPALVPIARVPKETNNVISFYLPRADINVTLITPLGSSCGGHFCDRQIPKATKCGCYSQPRTTNPIVLQAKITVVHENITNPIETNFSSVHFMSLAFKTDDEIDLLDGAKLRKNILKIRETYKKLTNHINRREKWTVIGWRIRTNSSSNSNEVKEVNLGETISDHVIYVSPSAEPDIDTFRSSPDALTLHDFE